MNCENNYKEDNTEEKVIAEAANTFTKDGM